MTTLKIIDTCTLINIFDCADSEIIRCLRNYNVMTTDMVISEYTRKIPRNIPDCLSVVGLRDDDEKITEEMEYLFPNLGCGERSVFVLALNMAKSGEKVVVLSDDKRAVKNYSAIAKKEGMRRRFPGSENIIWANIVSLAEKFAQDGKLTQEHVSRIKRAP